MTEPEPSKTEEPHRFEIIDQDQGRWQTREVPADSAIARALQWIDERTE